MTHSNQQSNTRSDIEKKIREVRLKRGKTAPFDKWAAFHIDDLIDLIEHGYFPRKQKDPRDIDPKRTLDMSDPLISVLTRLKDDLMQYRESGAFAVGYTDADAILAAYDSIREIYLNTDKENTDDAPSR